MPYYVDGVAHYSGDRLIWLYDIHLLAQALRPDQWADFVSLAGKKGLRAVCLEGIEQARDRFATPVPADVMDALTQPGPAELPAIYLDANHLRRRWMNLCAQEGLGNKLRYALELAFPPADYMHERFPDAWPGSLPWLYARRALGGLRRRPGRH